VDRPGFSHGYFLWAFHVSSSGNVPFSEVRYSHALRPLDQLQKCANLDKGIMRYETQQKIWNISVLMSILLFVAGFIWLVESHNRNVEVRQAACWNRGGHVIIIQDGPRRGGWFCLEGRE